MLFNKTTAYLIDTENVGSTFIELIKKDESKKDLYIFVTENAKNLSFPLLKELTDKSIKLHIIDCEIGKNSLDFYLANYLGYLIGKNAHSDYVVVSQDTGFDHVITYWNKQGQKIKRIDTKLMYKKSTRTYKRRPYIRRTPKPVSTETMEQIKVDVSAVSFEKPKKAYIKQTKREVLKTCLPDYSDEQLNDIKNTLDSVSSKRCQEVYVTMVKKYKQEEGLKIYAAVKHSLRKYYHSLEENQNN